MKKFRKLFIGLGIISMIIGISSPTLAATVYYKNKPVYWEAGRTQVVYSFSQVQSAHFKHAATANHVFSGWKNAGTTAYAQAYVGNKVAQCYWSCQ